MSDERMQILERWLALCKEAHAHLMGMQALVPDVPIVDCPHCKKVFSVSDLIGHFADCESRVRAELLELTSQELRPLSQVKGLENGQPWRDAAIASLAARAAELGCLIVREAPPANPQGEKP